MEEEENGHLLNEAASLVDSIELDWQTSSIYSIASDNKGWTASLKLTRFVN